MNLNRVTDTIKSKHLDPSPMHIESAKLIPKVLVALGLALTIGVYAAFGQIIFASFWLKIALASLASAVILPWFLKAPERWLFAILVVSLSFSARLRVFSSKVHLGGAEAAIAPLDFPLLALVSLYFLKDLKNRMSRWLWGPVETRIVIFGMMSSFSLFVAPNISFGVYELLRLVKVLLLLACIKRFVRTESSAKFTIYLMIGIALAQSLLGIAQLTLNRSLGLDILGEADQIWLDTSIGQGASRVGGTLGHANNLALFLELLLPLCFSLFISVSASPEVRQLALLTLCTGSVAMIFTLSRSGWAAFAFGLGIVLLVQFRAHSLITKRKFYALLVISLTSLAVILLLWDTIYTRLIASSPYSFVFRRNLMVIALEMLKTHPITGTGLNNFVVNIPRYDPVGIVNRDLPVHNIYLLIAAETGLLGFFAFAWLLLTIMRIAWQAIKLSQGIFAASAQGLFASIVAILVHSMLGWGWRFDVIYMLFWFIVGFLVSLVELAKVKDVNVLNDPEAIPFPSSEAA